MYRLSVADLERAVRFSCDVMGFELVSEGYPG